MSMVVTKCSRLLRFGSRPSVKLLKAVIGIGLSFVSQRLRRQFSLPTAGGTTSVLPKRKVELASSKSGLTIEFTGRRGVYIQLSNQTIKLRDTPPALPSNDWLSASAVLFRTPFEKRTLEPFWSGVHRRRRFVARYLFGTPLHLRERRHVPFCTFSIRCRWLNIPHTLPLSVGHNLRPVLLRLTLIHQPSIVRC